MNTREVKILVDKYFGGETTLPEEEELRRFFNSENVPEELRDLIPVFAFFRKEKQIVTSEKPDAAIFSTAVPAKMIPLYRKRSFWLTVSGIAASVIFILAVVIESGRNQLPQQNKFAGTGYTKEDARIAFDQTREVLAYVSDKLSHGVEPLNKVSKIGYSSVPASEMRKFDKGLNNLAKNVDKMDRGVSQLDKLSKFDIIIKL